MNSQNYTPQPFPLYGCQIVPFVFPSPLFPPQSNYYYPPVFPPNVPMQTPNAMKQGENTVQLSPMEPSQARSTKGEKRRHLSLRTGPWTAHEHKLFLDAMKKHGNNWPAVVECVGTRSAPQVRSHAQKHYKRLRKSAIAKIKRDPEKRKAVFVITQEYRHHNRVYKVAQKIEDKKMGSGGYYAGAPMLAGQISINQGKGIEGCTQ